MALSDRDRMRCLSQEIESLKGKLEAANMKIVELLDGEEEEFDFKEFQNRLTSLINSRGIDNFMNVPDYILAEIIVDTLKDYRKFIQMKMLHEGITEREGEKCLKK